MSSDAFIRKKDRSQNLYGSGKRVSDYTVRELADLLEHIEFWILDLDSGKFSDPFFIAAKLDDRKRNDRLNNKYGELPLEEIVALLGQFTFHLSKTHPKYKGPGTSYRVRGETGKSDCPTPIWKSSLKELGALLPRVVFDVTDVTNIKTPREFERRLKGDPEGGYEKDPSLAKAHGDFSVQDLLDALRSLAWNITEGDQEFHCTLHALWGRKDGD
jgi:hypothetical protein